MPLTLSATQKGILAILVATALLSSMDAMSKVLTARYDALFVVWARYMGQAVFTLIVFAPRLSRVMATRRLRLQVVRSALLFVATIFFFLGFKLMPLAEATAIAQIAPLLIMALAAFLLGEPVRPFQWVAAIVGFLGAMVIVQPGAEAFNWACVFPIGGALLFSGFSIATRSLGASDPVWTTFFYTGAVGAVAATVAAPFSWETPALADLPLLAVIGVIGALGQGSLIVAMKFAPASFIAPFIYLQLIWAALLGYLVFGNTPAETTVIGAVIVVGAGLAAQRGGAFLKPKAPASR